MIRVVAAIIERLDGKILIGKRRLGDTNAGRWEFPGGKIRPGELAEEALEREILEELNITLSHISFFSEVTYTYPQYTVNILFFKAKTSTPEEVSNLCHDELSWIHPSQYVDFDILDANQEVFHQILQQ